MDLSIVGSFVITYAVVQTLVFLLLLRFVDLYEREPLSALAVMALWGAVGATALSAAGNRAAAQLLPARVNEVFGIAITAPLVEEVAKGIALIVFVAISLWARGRFGIPHFEGVTDGIVYGAAVGLGFAFTEDVLYLLLGASEGGLEQGFLTYLGRRDFFGISMLHHAIYSSAFGVGLGLATWSRKRIARLALPVSGLALAVLLHAINNGLVRVTLVLRYGLEETAAFVQGSGVADPVAMEATRRQISQVVNTLDYVLFALFILAVQLWLAYQRKVIREELAEEVRAGLISRSEFEMLPYYWRRTKWYLQLVKTGQWERLRLLRRIHNELVDLAFSKRRLRRRGDAAPDVEERRRLINRLKAQKLVFLT